MPDKQYFRLYACCVPVRGAARSTLCDLQRGTFHLIPNALYDILTSHRDMSLEEVKAEYGPEHEETVSEYFEFLLENELGFWTREPERFPDLDLTYEKPELINNAIIDVDQESAHDFGSIFRQLDDVGCRFLQLRFFTTWDLDRLETEVLACGRQGRLRGIELVLRDDPAWSQERLDALCQRHPRLTTIYVHSANEELTKRIKGSDTWVLYRTEELKSHDHCGHSHPAYFSVTYECFLEAQKNNTCLNRKVSVDARGEIRNCPAIGVSYGNVADTSLHSAIARKGFRDLWQINKDQIDVCKDCEFRYICTDCRAFIADTSNIYSKPSKCTYDPYTAEWR